jgi:hypothetical protein
MIKQKRPRTNRVCIADVAHSLEMEYKERINQIKKIQMESNLTFKQAEKIYNTINNPLDLIERELFTIIN